MKIKLRYPTPPSSLEDILTFRGVEDLDAFMRPSEECLLNPYDLDNIEEAADLYLRHLKNNSRICYPIDCDTDGFSSGAILWNYTKTVFPNANLHFTCHTHKQHGLEDKIDWLVNDTYFNLVVCVDSASFDGIYMRQLQEVGTEILVLD